MRTVLLVLSLIYGALCQENAGTNVSPSLEVCYNTTRFETRDYRLPSSVNILVEILRKIEDGNPSQDAREIAYKLLHRFRQDGIRKSSRDIDATQGLPYSPKGWEAYKNRLQLTQLTPGNAITFNNNSLSPYQSCSFHYMISSTIETQGRDDKDSVCSRIAHYKNRIHKRQIELAAEDTTRSQCPVESGVIYTKWGAVKAGLVLAGIASGFLPNPQTVDNTYRLETAYASTIAGELAEAAIRQPSVTKVVGNRGGWNLTAEPKYYFLDQSDLSRLYLTDAEIRGGFDGLHLALNIDNWRSKSNNLKVSQIVDLYYGRGVFNTTSRACNRKNLIQDYLRDPKLPNQTVATAILLDKVSQLSYSLKKETIPSSVSATIDSLRQYLSSNLQDLECSAEDEYIERVSTDVLIFVDVAWPYESIQPLLSYILESIDVNKYESSYTIYDGARTDIIVNKSRSILDYYEQFNRTQQQKYPTGFDYIKVIQKAEEVFKAKLDNETDVTGQSLIILMLPHAIPTSNQREYLRDKKYEYKNILPDVRVLVASSGSASDYNDIVTIPQNDFIQLQENSDDEQIKSSGGQIVTRFRKIPRSVINPRCGSTFSKQGADTFDVTQYVEPSGINYHRISANYFYEGRRLKIQGQGMGTLTVCYSRVEINPKDNSTGVTCQNIVSDEVDIDISNYCTDDSAINCGPIYVSVKGETTNVRCTENSCRFPDNIKYVIRLEEVHCSSCNELLIPTLLLVILLFLTMQF